MDLQDKEEQRRQDITDNYYKSAEIMQRQIQRLKIADASDKNPEARILTYKLCERESASAEGCIFFIENFGWTYNSRMLNIGRSAHLPFVLYDFQKDAIRSMVEHIENGRDILLEKSRDMGVTWLVVWIFLWLWLFRDGTNLLVGSYKEALVDNRTDDSMFGRIDYALDSLPKWLMPKGFNKNKHRTKLKLQNPANYNLIAGDTMNPDFGRGSRKTAVFFDELGSWDYAKDAWESTGDVTNCRIANSTPKGYNFYAKLRNSGIDLITLHWTQHPLKDQEWYEYECARRTPEEVAQELDISYNKSQEGRVYPEWNESNVNIGSYEYDDTLPLYVGWDFGKEDPTCIIWSQPKNGRLRIVDSYTRNGKNIDFFVPFVTGLMTSEGYDYTKTDYEIIERHKAWKKGTHFGDPAGRNGNQVNDATVLTVLKSHGININYHDTWQPHQKRKRAVKALVMGGIDINKNDMTEYLNMAIENATYPKVKVQGEDEIRSLKPKHDWTCLRGDTEIRTLDGWKTIESLVAKKDFYVWGYSQEQGRLMPTRVNKVWKTHDNADLIEIILDNNESLFLTENHRVMLRDGSYKRADAITIGDSLMPFYENNNGGYIDINLNDGSLCSEHQYVYSKLNGQIPIDYHIDHMNGIKTDNRPENLAALSPMDHCKKTFGGKLMSERKLMSVNKKPYVTKYSKSNIHRLCLFCGKKFKADHKTFYCSKKHSVLAWKERNSFANRKIRNHKVLEIRKAESAPVYDMETDLHNFVANGVVVHNSHYRSSFEYLALGLEEFVHRTLKPRDKFKNSNPYDKFGRRKSIGY